MIIGLDQFERDLKNIAEKMIEGKMLQAAILKAVQPLVNVASALAPKGSSGKLSRSMTTQFLSSTSTTEIVARVGPGYPEGSHGILLEYGTVHMTARPFLASAYEATHEEILAVFESELNNGL